MDSYLVEALTFALIFAIAGSGIYVLTGLCGQVSLAQGAYMAIGASTFSYLARTVTDSGNSQGQGLIFVVAFPLAVLITGIVASLFGAMTIRLKGASAISASIAVSVIVLYVVERTKFLSGGSRGADAPDILAIGNTDFLSLNIAGREFDSKTGLLLLVSMISIAVFFYIRILSRSPLARAMRTIRERDEASQTFAISPTKTIVSAHFVMGLCAGVAGALYAPFLESFEINSSNPWLGTFGLIASMQLLAFVVVGGMRKYAITALVVALLAFLSSFLSEYSSDIAFLDVTQGGNVSPSQMTAIVSSLLVIGIIHFRAQYLKKKL